MEREEQQQGLFLLWGSLPVSGAQFLLLLSLALPLSLLPERKKRAAEARDDKMDAALLLFLCLPPALQHQDADTKRKLRGAGHILGFNDVFNFFPCFREDLDQEEKARFGELCSSENGKGREWFARYVSAQVRGVVGRQQGFIYIPEEYFWKAGTRGK